MKTVSRRTFLASSVIAATGVFKPAPLFPSTTPLTLFKSRTGGSETPSSDWRSHGWSIEQTRHNLGETIIDSSNVTGLSVRWEFEASSGITGTPAVVGDRVVVGSWDGRVYALNRTTGKPVWIFDGGLRKYPPDRQLGVFASPAVDEHFVYVASDRIRAIDLETGKQIWQRIVGEPERTFEYFWAPPLIYRAKVFAGASDGSETETRGRIVCIDRITGALRWNFFTVAPKTAGGALFAAMSLDARSNILFAATGSPFRAGPGKLAHSCSLIALDADKGTLRWADQVHPHDTLNLDLNCPPMLLSIPGKDRPRHLIVVGGKDGIRAWDRQTRRRLWHIQITPPLAPNGKESLPTNGPETGPTAAGYGLVFFASNNHTDKTCLLAAIDPATGDLRWIHSLPGFQFGPMSVANGVVYLGLADGKLRAWRARDGELLWESSRMDPIAAGPAISHGMVFIGTGAGTYLPGKKLIAFGPKT